MPHTFKRILTLSGSNLDGGAPACPISGSLYVADVGYEIRVRRYTTLAEGFHARTRTRDVLVARDYYCLPLRKDDEAGSFGRNAYLCLKRGNECGGDDFAREVAHMRDTDGAAPGKKAITATARMARVARDTASSVGGEITSLGSAIGDRLKGYEPDDDGSASS